MSNKYKMPLMASSIQSNSSDDEFESSKRESGFAALKKEYDLRFNTLLEQVEFLNKRGAPDWYTFSKYEYFNFQDDHIWNYDRLSIRDIFLKLQFDKSSHYDPLKEYFDKISAETDVFSSIGEKKSMPCEVLSGWLVELCLNLLGQVQGNQYILILYGTKEKAESFLERYIPPELVPYVQFDSPEIEVLLRNSVATVVEDISSLNFFMKRDQEKQRNNHWEYLSDALVPGGSNFIAVTSDPDFIQSVSRYKTPLVLHLDNFEEPIDSVDQIFANAMSKAKEISTVNMEQKL